MAKTSDENAEQKRQCKQALSYKRAPKQCDQIGLFLKKYRANTSEKSIYSILKFVYNIYNNLVRRQIIKLGTIYKVLATYRNRAKKYRSNDFSQNFHRWRFTSSELLLHQHLSVLRKLSNFDGFRRYLELAPLRAGRVRPHRVLPGTSGHGLKLLLHLAAELQLAHAPVLRL